MSEPDPVAFRPNHAHPSSARLEALVRAFVDDATPLVRDVYGKADDNIRDQQGVMAVVQPVMALMFTRVAKRRRATGSSEVDAKKACMDMMTAIGSAAASAYQADRLHPVQRTICATRLAEAFLVTANTKENYR